MAFNGDISVPTGQQADVVLVAGGTATVAGNVKTLVVSTARPSSRAPRSNPRSLPAARCRSTPRPP
jgi:hypothetical protein